MIKTSLMPDLGMKFILKTLTFLTITFVLLSCANKSNDFVAIIDGKQLLMGEIDQTIQDQLYESLFGIYYKRGIALDEYVGYELLGKEAGEKKISIDSLKLLICVGSTEGLKSYVVANFLQGGIPDPDNPLIIHNLESSRGKVILEDSYRQWLLQTHIEELKKKYSVEYFLYPPLPSAKNLVGLNFQSRGNPKSKIKITVIADFNCGACHEFMKIFLEVYKKNLMIVSLDL